MKKLFIMVAAAVALSLTGCDGGNQQASKGAQLAEQLDKAVEKQDTAAALAAEKAIREAEKEIMATNDSAAIADFLQAVAESRQRNAAYLTAIKVKSGVSNENAVKDVIQDALNGDVDINAVTSSVDAALNVKENKK